MGEVWMGLGQDVRYAGRGLRRAPGFAVTAVLTLGLGIGATATMYSVVRDVLLAALPYPEAERLVGIGFTYPQARPTGKETGASAQFVADHTRSFESVGLAEWGSTGANLSAGVGRTQPLAAMKVTAGYFPTFGVQPVVGRSFTAAEDLPGGPRVAMLSYWVWQRTFGGDRGVVGRVVRINEEPYTVVGVMPEWVPESPMDKVVGAGVWLPMQLSPKTPGYDGGNFTMIGRLRRGVTLAQAQQELDGLKLPFHAAFPSYREWTNSAKLLHGFEVWPLQEVVVSEVRRSLLVLLAAVSAVLLVACLNLAGLMTARVATRRREMALRTALGATRGGLLRLLVSESLLLAVAGGALGLGLAEVARPALLAAAPLGIPGWAGHGRWGVAGFVALVAMAVTVLCGLLPGWTVFRQDAQAGLRGGEAAGGDASQVRVGKGLMVGQVAVAMVLLSAATMLLGSFLKLQSMASGVEAKRLTVAQVSLKGAGYEGTLATTQFVARVVEALGRTPGVERVVAVNGLPLDRGLNIGGRPADRPEMRVIVEFRTVTPGYFQTVGVPLRLGRELEVGDRARTPLVVVVNETAARRWWPGRSPIGERVVVGGKGEPERTVVGVVGDVRTNSLAEAPEVMLYAPMEQMSDAMTKILNGWFPTTFAIRTGADVDLEAAVRAAVSGADAEMPVAKLSTMQGVIDETVAGPRFFSWMAGGFAGFAVALTVIGLFGLLSYQVTQRTREIGVRMAVGADRGEILGMIVRRGMGLTAVGLGIGLVGSLGVPRVVRSLLEDTVYTNGAGVAGVLANGGGAMAVAAVAMMLAAGVASYLPGTRAAGVEPVEALRAE